MVNVWMTVTLPRVNVIKATREIGVRVSRKHPMTATRFLLCSILFMLIKVRLAYVL